MIGLAHWRLMAVLAAIAVAVGLLVGAYVMGRSDGHAAAKLDQLRAGLEAERARRSVDDEARRLSDRDLCLRLGGMPDDCELM